MNNLELRNAKFHKLSPANQRVEIAKDVLLQLKAKKYVASSGTYFNINNGTPSQNRSEFFRERSAQKAIEIDGVKCSVCARGAIFASRCRLGNDAINPVSDAACTSFSIQERNVLTGIFSSELKYSIEYLFELGNYSDRWAGYIDKHLSALDSWCDVQRRTDKTAIHRMKLLMKNLIRNKGSLVISGKTIV